jgi:hypothetical protein
MPAVRRRAHGTAVEGICLISLRGFQCSYDIASARAVALSFPPSKRFSRSVRASASSSESAVCQIRRKPQANIRGASREWQQRAGNGVQPLSTFERGLIRRRTGEGRGAAGPFSWRPHLRAVADRLLFCPVQELVGSGGELARHRGDERAQPFAYGPASRALDRIVGFHWPLPSVFSKGLGALSTVLDISFLSFFPASPT